MTKKLIIFLLLASALLVNVPTALCSSPKAPVVYIDTDGSGDYNCDGKNDHIEINQALLFVSNNPGFTTVHLNGSNTYWINDTIYVDSNTILEGDSDAVIKLVNNANWGIKNKGFIEAKNEQEKNITIRGFQIDGNCKNQAESIGKGFYDMINLKRSYNVTVNNMYLHDGLGDGIKISHDYLREYETVPTNIKIYNNTIFEIGHDAIWLKHSSNAYIYNNIITIKADAGIRLTETMHIKVYNNTITANYKGYAGIELDKKMTDSVMNDIEIYDNIIHHTHAWGIWVVGYGKYNKDNARGVWIHHNMITDTGTSSSLHEAGGIVIQGFNNTIIENNVIDGNRKYGVAYELYPAYGIPKDTGFVTTLRNNIISNTIRNIPDAGSGWGVKNCDPTNHTFILENNCVYKSAAANYINVISTTDLNVDPLFANILNRDYHLKSAAGRWSGNGWVIDQETSPLIDAGNPMSNYNNEPEPNGDRINIGRYGNTIYASRSLTAPVKPPEESTSQESVLSEVELYDNRLREASPEAVYQNALYLDVGGMNSVRYRDVLLFNLSEYTGSDEVNNATLSLYWYYPEGESRPEDTVIEVYRPASSWNSSYVSWNKRDKDIAWNNAGGDWYDKNGVVQGSTPYATLTLKGSNIPDNRYYELDVTDLVKEYISGKYTNTGFLIKARTESNNYIAFYSGDCENESQKPKINVTKKVPAVTVNATIIGAKDNRLREASPEAVYQNALYLDVGGMNSVRYRDVLLFNLSEYTGSDEVNNATLSLYWYYPEGESRPEDTVIEVYRPASSWNSSYVSWNKRDKDIAWNNAGGDWYDKNGVAQGSTPYATLTLKGSNIPDNRYYELDVTDLVREYISGKYTNTGFLIKARTESNNYIAFYSSDCESESQKPKINVTKKVPAVTVNETVTDVTDNRLRQVSPDTVYQSSAFIDVGGINSVRYRDVLLFNLSEYTGSDEVNNATLSLYWYYAEGELRPEDTVIEVYRPASSWNSSYVSWNKRDKDIAWNNAGGDWYDKNGVAQGSTPYATLTLKGSNIPDNRYYELDVTDLVKGYISGKYTNTGFLIKARTESNNYIAFYSSDCGNESQSPILNIEVIK